MKIKRILTLLIVFTLVLTFGLTGCKKPVPDNKPVFTQNALDFDKANPADAVFTVDYKGQSVTKITYGSNDLAAANYATATSTLTIKKEYLATLNNDKYNFTLVTAGGSADFSVTVKNTAPSTETPDPFEDVEFYNNTDYHAWKGNLSTIANQWEGYGIGDPYILRYNGVYYLYVSTKDSEVGVRAYKSTDLINWGPCQGAGLAVSYVSVDPVTRAAYAPEVIYYDGMFYMYTSPAGDGHFILESNHPEGPFTAVTGNIGKSIDGSVFIDDDEKMYFTRANNQGISIHEMTSPVDIADSQRVLQNTQIGSWTEGSYIIKKNGIYYLTYTGNHVASNGYRVSYSWSSSANPREQGYVAGADLPIILNTSSDDFTGLGHSATVMGPDMDSYYITYHNLNSAGGPNRSLNIDRLFFNGSQMTSVAKATNSVVPKLPRFTATGVADTIKFSVSDGFTLSTASTNAAFTAEYNLSGSDNVKFIAGYTDSNNYSYVKVDATAKKIYLQKVAGGSDTKVAEGTIVNDYDFANLYTIRIASGNGKTEVYFNNLLKITDNSTIADGKIGYNTAATVVVGYTAFSDVSMGLSDMQEIKQSAHTITANNYMPNNFFEGLNGNMLGTGSGVTVIDDSSQYKSANTLKLANRFDYARYAVNFDADGFYGLEMVFDKQYMGSTIAVQFDEGDSLYFDIPTQTASSSDKWIRAIVSEFDIDAGIRAVKIENYGTGAFEFVSFRFVKTSKSAPQFTNTLAEYVDRGAEYATLWKLADDGHRALAGNQQVLYLGDDTLTDFTLTVEMKFIGESGASTAGVILRSKNHAMSPHDNYASIQGYYVSVNNTQMRAQKLNYSITNMANAAKAEATASGEFFTLKVVARGNKITVYKNNVEMFTTFDALGFTSGRIGLYTNGAEAIYKNISIQP